MRCSSRRFTIYRLIRGTSGIYLHAPRCYIKDTSHIHNNDFRGTQPLWLTLRSTSQASNHNKNNFSGLEIPLKATCGLKRHNPKPLTQASKCELSRHQNRLDKQLPKHLASNTIDKLTSQYSLSRSLTQQQPGLLLILSDPRSSLILKAYFRSLHAFYHIFQRGPSLKYTLVNSTHWFFPSQGRSVRNDFNYGPFVLKVLTTHHFTT